MSIFHATGREGGAFQRKTLYIFAKRIELPLLRLSFRLLRGDLKPWGDKKWMRRLLATFIGRPIMLFGDTAMPVPYEQVVKHIESLDCVIAAGTCRCRTVHKACGHPMFTDIVVRTGADAWLKAFPGDYRVIEKSEALKIIADCHNNGMFHMIFYHCPSTALAEYVVCNCCRCGCVPHILNRELGQSALPFFRGGFYAVTDKEKCRGCGKCAEICPFDARAVINGKGATTDCFGCGLCVYNCPEGAISLVPDQRSHHDHPGIPLLAEKQSKRSGK